MKSKTEKVTTDEEKEQYSKEFRETLKQVRKDYMKDKKDAYKFIAKHIDGWWD
jgi:ABC-type transporter MlaC component